MINIKQFISGKNSNFRKKYNLDNLVVIKELPFEVSCYACKKVDNIEKLDEDTIINYIDKDTYDCNKLDNRVKISFTPDEVSEKTYYVFLLPIKYTLKSILNGGEEIISTFSLKKHKIKNEWYKVYFEKNGSVKNTIITLLIN